MRRIKETEKETVAESHPSPPIHPHASLANDPDAGNHRLPLLHHYTYRNVAQKCVTIIIFLFFNPNPNGRFAECFLLLLYKYILSSVKHPLSVSLALQTNLTREIKANIRERTVLPFYSAFRRRGTP